MLTAIVSDLHLGTTSGADVARRPEVLDRLLAALADAERVVLLGDLLEMRESAAHAVLEVTAPFLAAFGEACAGKRVVLVPGNHDYELVAPALDAAQLDSGGPLGLAGVFDPGTGALSREVAALMPGAEVSISYPGVWVRDDVYALHGHYLDLHLTVPRIECVLASAVGRLSGIPGRDEIAAPDDYEAGLAPIYALAHSLVQRRETAAVTRGSNFSRAIYGRTSGASLADLALGRFAIPAGVAAINALGLGPFRSDISPVELRRAGLRAMGEVVRRLGIDAKHVLFGHTHRAGPLPRDVEGWTLPGGTRLHNTGSWLHEEVFMGGLRDARNPYFPGAVTYVGDDGPPELRNVLEGWEP